MMTGCGPARHGVFDHRYYDAAEGRMKVNHSGRIRVPTVWHLLSGAGRSIVSLNVPGVYPPLKVRGIVVSGMDAPHLEAALSAPRVRGSTCDRCTGYGLGYFWKGASIARRTDQKRRAHRRQLPRPRSRGACSPTSSSPTGRCLMVQFQNLDPFQHRVWPYLNVDETGSIGPSGIAPRPRSIRGFDDAIGVLCDLADKRGAAVMMVSDHGFGPCLGRVHVNRILVKAGVARLPGWAGLIERPHASGRRPPPALGPKRGDPAARSASFDQSLSAQFPFDWKRTLAFAPHQDTAAMVYVNSPPVTAASNRAHRMSPPPDRRRPNGRRRMRSPTRNTPKTARGFSRRSSKRPRPTRSIPPARDIPT